MTINENEPEIVKRGLLARLRGWFFTGLLVTAPVLLTVYITWAAIELIDGQVNKLIPAFSTWSLGDIPGAGLLVGGVLITLIGAVAAGFLGRWIIRLGESLLNRMPVVRTIYGATKQILETVISAQSDAFREVVLVEYPRRGLWVIGFVTGATKGEVARMVPGSNVNVFIPTTPNPTSGFLLFCPVKDIIYLDMTNEEAVKLVVSGGIVSPPDRGNVAAKNVKKSCRQKSGYQKASSQKSAVNLARGQKLYRAIALKKAKQQIHMRLVIIV